MSDTPIGAASYYRYMGFDDESLHTRYQPYRTFFVDHTSVVDIGCGTGAFLSLLKEAGVSGTGVDPDPGQVSRCKSKGLSAVESDAVTYLRSHKNIHDGLFCAHLLEHMDGDRAAQLISVSYEALRPAATAVFVTPNPASLQSHLREFWRDPTHVRFYSVEAVSYLMVSAGFEIVETGDNKLHRTAESLLKTALLARRWWTKLISRQIERRLHQITPLFGLDQGDEIYVVGRKAQS